MGILDRMVARGLAPDGEDQTTEDSTSTTLAPVESVVLQRLQITLDYFTKSLAKAKGQQNGTMSKATFMLNMVSREMLEEAAEVPPEIIALYMDQLAAVVHWCASGQYVPEMPLPDDFPFHPMNAPQNVPEPADRYKEIAVIPE